MPKTVTGTVVNIASSAATLAADPITGFLLSTLASNSDGVAGVGRKAISRVLNGTAPPQNSNHVLFDMIYKARWQAVAQVAISCDRDFPRSCRLDQDHNLKKIYNIATEQADQKIGESRDPLDIDKKRLSNRLVTKWLRIFGRDTSDRSADDENSYYELLDRAACRALPELLAREAENRALSEEDRSRPHDETEAFLEAATEQQLKDLWEFTRTFSESGVPDEFMNRFRDPKLGWGAHMRFALKAHLDDPENGGTAKRVLLNLAAETHNTVVDLKTLTKGIDKNVENISDHLATMRTRFDAIDTSLADILERLNPPLHLDPIGRGDENNDTYLKLVYTAQATDLIGRDTELGKADDLGALDYFMADTIGAENDGVRNFVWWQIAGDGGQGKSRLALELIQRYALDWHTGFLRTTDLSNIEWEKIDFPRPTLIVVDYVAAPKKASEVGSAIAKLHLRAGALMNPVRLLIIERSGFTFDDTNQIQPLWFRSLLDADGNAGRVSESCFYSIEPLTLRDYSPETMVAIANSWRASQGKSTLTDEQSGRLLDKMGYTSENKTERNRARRPLFAMLFADFVTESDHDFKIADALRVALATDQKLWAKDEYDHSDGAPKDAQNLAILATILSEIRKDMLEAIRARGEFYNIEEPRTLAFANRQTGFPPIETDNTNNRDTDAPIVRGREPDLLGELMINDLLCSTLDDTVDKDRATTIMEDAWAIDPHTTYAFLTRLAEDLEDLELRPLQRTMSHPPPPEEFVENRNVNLLANSASYYGISGLLSIILSLPAGQAKHPNENTMSNGAFPLLFAAQEGHEEVVNALINCDGINVNQIDAIDGTFPLLMAAQEGHEEVVNALINCDGINVNLRNPKDGAFPLLMAAQNGHEKVVNALINCDGINVNLQNTENGAFPLLMAAQNGHEKVVNALINCDGINVNQIDAIDGTFPLLMAAQEGHEEVVNALINCDGINVNLRNPKDGAFPLLMAAQNGHTEVIGMLLDAGARVTEGDISAIGFLRIQSLKGEIDPSRLPETAPIVRLREEKQGAQWLDGPALAATWEEFNELEWTSLVGVLSEALSIEGFAEKLSGAALTNARRTNLSFYPGWRLVEAQLTGLEGQIPRIGRMAILSALACDAGAVVLDGTSVSLHKLNKDFIQLETEEQRRAYLAFFCNFVRGEESPFRIVTSIDELLFETQISADERAKLEQQFSPLTSIEIPDKAADDVIAAYRATISYSNALFIANFAIKTTGMLEMLDDTLLAADLPLLLPRYEGPFRTGPMPPLDDQDDVS